MSFSKKTPPTQRGVAPEDKEEFQPEEGDSSNLRQSGSSPNDAVDETVQGKEDTLAQDEDGTG